MLFRYLMFLSFAFFSALSATPNDKPVGSIKEFQFENEHVKVWKTTFLPHQPLKMHRHDKPRIVVGLKGGTLTKFEETGEISDLIYDTHKAYWIPEDAPDVLHGDINNSDENIEVMIIEFKTLKTPKDK